MKTVITYVAKDDTRFDDSAECIAYESILANVETIFNRLKPREIESSREAIQQNVQDVEAVRKAFFTYCAEVIPSYKDVFIKVAETPKLTLSMASRILDDYGHVYPVLNRACYRLDCINMESGIEYQQPFYALHEDAFEGTTK